MVAGVGEKAHKRLLGFFWQPAAS